MGTCTRRVVLATAAATALWLTGTSPGFAVDLAVAGSGAEPAVRLESLTDRQPRHVVRWLRPRPWSKMRPSRPSAAVWPLRPRPQVVRGFEPPAEPWLSGHRGVDLAGTAGQRVASALAGTISYAGRIAGVGVVTVSHGRLRTTYQPVLATVRVGEKVAAGGALGRLSAAGSHCARRACLHWGLLRGRQYLDPLSLVTVGAPRLLPLLSRPPPPGAGQPLALVGDAGGRRTPPATTGGSPTGPGGRTWSGPVLAVVGAAGLAGAAAATYLAAIPRARARRPDP